MCLFGQENNSQTDILTVTSSETPFLEILCPEVSFLNLLSSQYTFLRKIINHSKGHSHIYLKFSIFAPMTGIVYKSTGSWYQVKSEDGDFHKCRIKGKFRIKGIKSTNPIAVGDNVDFDVEKKGDEETGVIKKDY